MVILRGTRMLCAFVATTIAVVGCGHEKAAPAGAGSDQVRAWYSVALGKDGKDGRLKLEVVADGDRRVRLNYGSVVGTEGDELAGGWAVWDGRVLLTYSPDSDPRYTRTEDPDPGQRPAYVLVEGSDDFNRQCPDSRRLRTHIVLGRAAIRYACAASIRQKVPAEDYEMSVDQATGLLLERAGSTYTVEATAIELNPTVNTDIFSTDLPLGADERTGPRIEHFRLPQVGGGQLALTDYPPPLVIVAGDAAGIRRTVDRLLPLTQGGARPQVIGLLIVNPPRDWKGSLLDPKDAAFLAEEISRAAGTFRVPVAIDVKGAAAYPITQAAGVAEGQTHPTTVGFVGSGSQVAGTATEAAANSELLDHIDALR